MRIKPLLISFIIGLFSLSISGCSDHGHEHGGDSHGHSDDIAAQQQPAPGSTAHDNIDPQ